MNLRAIAAAIAFAVPPAVLPMLRYAGAPDADTILWSLHLPRLAAAAEVGVLLSLSGLLLQTLFRNPLADPFTLGVSGGAALAVGAAVLLGAAALLPWALAGGLVPVVLLLALARRSLPGESEGILVAGIGITATTAAGLLVLQYLMPGGDALRLLYWLMGDLSVVGWGTPLRLVPSVLLVAALVLARARALDLALEGEEVAAARGLAVGRLRVEWILLASWATAATVAEVGPIFFVGLIVPNLVRARCPAAGHDRLVPWTILLGALALPWCDLAARLLSPAPIPIGLATALVGGPFLLWAVRSARAGGG